MPIGLNELRVDHYIAFKGDAIPRNYDNRFFQIVGEEPIRYKTGDTDTAEFTAVAFGATSGYRNIEVLEPDPKHLYGLDIGIQDGCRYFIKVPTGRDRLGLDEDMDVGYIDNLLSPWLHPNPVYGIWLVDTMYPAIDAHNDCPKSVTPRVYFYGKKYEIAPVTDMEVLARLRAYKEGRGGGQVFRNITLGGVMP